MGQRGVGGRYHNREVGEEMGHKDQNRRIKQLYRICVINSIGVIIAALAIIAVSTLRG
jgi:hypothetical protein